MTFSLRNAATITLTSAVAVLATARAGHTDGDSPAAQAKALLARQTSDDAGQPSPVADDALVFPRTSEARTGNWLGELTAARGAKPIIGGTADVAWIVAELTQPYSLLDCPVALARCHKKRPVRVTELVASTPKGWQVVAAHVQSKVKGGGTPGDLPATTAPGPLTAWLTDPVALAAALADTPDVVVLGTEPKERAVGKKAGARLLTSWRKLALSIAGAPREVRTARWGYAAANVDWTRKPDDVVHMRATVFATSTDGAHWSAVVVQYSLADFDE